MTAVVAEGIEELLERVPQRFEDRYVGVFARLDGLLAVTPAGAAHAGGFAITSRRIW